MDMKRIRQIAMLCLLGVILGIGAAWLEVNSGAEKLARIEPAAGSNLAGAAIGGSFTLTDHNGQVVTDQDYAGSYKLVFFGFTHCPDICPAGLQKITAALEALGPKAGMVQPLFITVDPERDTPEVLKAYVELFYPSLIGLTGSKEQVKAAEAAYKVYSAKVEDDALNGYSMNHSAYTYFMGPEGEPLGLFSAQNKPAEMAQSMRAILPQDSL